MERRNTTTIIVYGLVHGGSCTDKSGAIYDIWVCLDNNEKFYLLRNTRDHDTISMTINMSNDTNTNPNLDMWVELTLIDGDKIVDAKLTSKPRNNTPGPSDE